MQRTIPGARAGTHRDRLVTLMNLADCYQRQDRISEAVAVYDLFLKELDDMGDTVTLGELDSQQREPVSLKELALDLVGR